MHIDNVKQIGKLFLLEYATTEAAGLAPTQ